MGSISAEGDRFKLTIKTRFPDLTIGESIAVNGACLTVVETGSGTFSVEAVATTRERTTLAELEVGGRTGGHRYGGCAILSARGRIRGHGYGGWRIIPAHGRIRSKPGTSAAGRQDRKKKEKQP